MVKISLLLSGETEGISNTGEVFTEAGLDFSAGKTVGNLPVSESYVNSMGTWAYTMKCPVVKEERELGVLYIEYIYDSFADSLPDGFYDGKAILYLMDIRNRDSLIFMWPVNGGAIYLIGYVPIEAIQQEGNTVNQNVLVVVSVMLAAFLFCCVLFYFSQRQQNKVRKEREEEREIHNKQLAEALQAAQIASNSKTTFLSNMSHDIRTPMNAILGFTALLAKDADNPSKVREYTRKITASGQHLLSLINDVLDVSKIESGKVVLTLSEFTLKDLTASVDVIIRPMANAKEQNFEISVTGLEHEYLIGDETRMNQILINLLSNAVKYTPEKGNIWFRIIGLKQHSEQYEHIRIEVEDDGYGMTPEYLEIIFDAFTRAENSTTNKVQGTGLGMAITKNIVELMGGRIEVSSEVDRGSLFRVELEAVDNELEICKSIQMLMKDTGISVDTVFSGEEAILRIQEASGRDADYDLILLDWKMPGMDGLETEKRIRSMMPEAVPIIFLTAYDGDEVREEVRHVEDSGNAGGAGRCERGIRR